jgi:hypothetical protein
VRSDKSGGPSTVNGRDVSHLPTIVGMYFLPISKSGNNVVPICSDKDVEDAVKCTWLKLHA